MSTPCAPHRSVLLIGHSLYLLAVEAVLRAEPGLTVHRCDGWASPPPLQVLDALIVDSLTEYKELLGALVSAYPEVLVIELAPGSHDRGQALVRYAERRTVDTAQELTRLITGTGPSR